MRESDLYPPVRDWLIARGYEVHVEIFDCDIVAVKDGRLLVVELKLCLARELFTQMEDAARWADEVMGAVASAPRKLGGLSNKGFGLLQVTDGRVRQRVKPRPQPHWWFKKRAYRIKKLNGRDPAMPHELAGLPSCPALRLQREQRTKPTTEPPAGETKDKEKLE